MTVVHHGNSVYTGVSGDTKPTTGVATNARFFETDTRRNYSYNGASWDPFSSTSRIQFTLVMSNSSQSTYNVRYFGLSSLLLQSTEATASTAYPYAFTVKRFIAKMGVNSVNGNTVLSFRDDAVDVTGAVATIAAGSTAEVDSGALNVAVAAGSQICFKCDTSPSASGSWLISNCYVIGEVLI